MSYSFGQPFASPGGTPTAETRAFSVSFLEEQLWEPNFYSYNGNKTTAAAAAAASHCNDLYLNHMYQ
jgi:hypothetical protein